MNEESALKTAIVYKFKTEEELDAFCLAAQWTEAKAQFKKNHNTYEPIRDIHRRLNERRDIMTYYEYKLIARARGFQPLKEKAFNAMIKAGFNFKTGAFN